MYELLSKLPESVAYTCTKCSDCHPAKWRTALEGELQGRLRHILTALLNSRTSAHLLHYRQVRNADWLFVDYTKKKTFAHVVTSPSGWNIIITFHTFFHFCAISGNAIANTTHFLSLFFFLCNSEVVTFLPPVIVHMHYERFISLSDPGTLVRGCFNKHMLTMAISKGK